ncbi:hypothetical protein [Methylocystis parvus]
MQETVLSVGLEITTAVMALSVFVIACLRHEAAAATVRVPARKSSR